MKIKKVRMVYVRMYMGVWGKGSADVPGIRAQPQCWLDSGTGSHCIHGAGTGETLRYERDESQFYLSGKITFTFS